MIISIIDVNRQTADRLNARLKATGYELTDYEFYADPDEHYEDKLYSFEFDAEIFRIETDGMGIKIYPTYSNCLIDIIPNCDYGMIEIQ